MPPPSDTETDSRELLEKASFHNWGPSICNKLHSAPLKTVLWEAVSCNLLPWAIYSWRVVIHQLLKILLLWIFVTATQSFTSFGDISFNYSIIVNRSITHTSGADAFVFLLSREAAWRKCVVFCNYRLTTLLFKVSELSSIAHHILLSLSLWIELSIHRVQRILCSTSKLWKWSMMWIAGHRIPPGDKLSTPKRKMELK